MPQPLTFNTTLDLMQSQIERNLNIYSHSKMIDRLGRFVKETNATSTMSDKVELVEETDKLSPWNQLLSSTSNTLREEHEGPYCSKYLPFCDDTPQTPRSGRSTVPFHVRSKRFSRFSCEDVSSLDNITKRSPNINPLMVASKVVSARKRKLSGSSSGNEDVKGLVAMLDSSPQTLFKTEETRFSKDFEIQEKLGSGSFGSVYLVRHRLDGVEYAVKQCKQVQFTGTRNTSCLREVWALSCITHHDNIVRYYCAWAESDFLYIQLEYCNAGSLAKVIRSQQVLSETEMKLVVYDVCKALEYIHHIGMVHLDIKPDNILMHCDDDDRREDTLDINANNSDMNLSGMTFKLADFGLATTWHENLSRKCPAVEDGDKYYLPQEMLSEDYSDLRRADIFSLAVSVYESGPLGGVVRDPDQWEQIHIHGHLPTIDLYSSGINTLLQSMVNADYRVRPLASDIVNSEAMLGVRGKTAALGHLLLAKERAEKENRELREKLSEMENRLVWYEQKQTRPEERADHHHHDPDRLKRLKSLDTSELLSLQMLTQPASDCNLADGIRPS